MNHNGQAHHDQPMIDATALVGLRISLDRMIDVCCGAFGQTIVVIGNDAGPHVASLDCATCNRHRGWLPKAIADFLVPTIMRFGRPSEAITIRSPEFAKANATAPLGAPRSQRQHPELLKKDNRNVKRN